MSLKRILMMSKIVLHKNCKSIVEDLSNVEWKENPNSTKDIVEDLVSEMLLEVTLDRNAKDE